MNAYVKQIVKARLEFLEMEEREIEDNIIMVNDILREQEEKLKKIREEKAALQNS
ncbi:hypothetical protein [Heyndrickxia camelliae]|uniref:hypothetical protein n=1 Tax=Heyndrickxia camelliae TaxID=1707093 RepID=UPI0013FD9B6F|nr:hypothetical protein [Heyndrickxia camelliae]